MRWVIEILNKVIKNLYKFFSFLFLCLLFVIFVSVSAQYIGNSLSQKILNNTTIKAIFFVNDNEVDNQNIDKIILYINNNNNLKQLKIKTKKLKSSDIDVLSKKNTNIIFSTDKEFMEKLSQQNKLKTLHRDIFKNSKQTTVFSKYDEYAKIITNYEDISLYIGYSSKDEHNSDNIKVLTTIKGLASILCKRDVEDPNEESLFR